MKKIIVGNWKLNLDHLQGIQLLQKINYSLDKDIEEKIDIVLAPSHTSLRSLQTVISTDNLKIKISSQDVSSQNDGAFTGEVSAFQLKKLNIDYSIIGHSERRSLFNENNKIVEEKFRCLESNNIMQVLCIGESLEEMESGKTLDVLNEQIASVLKNKTLKKALIAYEPIWAIGTGKTPTPIQVNQINQYIKDVVQSTTANNYLPKVLYGGSVNSENAAAFFSCENIDGALVGGASLDGKHFAEIVNEFNRIK